MTVIDDCAREREALMDAQIYHLSFAQQSASEKRRRNHSRSCSVTRSCTNRPVRLFLAVTVLLSILTGLIYADVERTFEKRRGSSREENGRLTTLNSSSYLLHSKLVVEDISSNDSALEKGRFFLLDNEELGDVLERYEDWVKDVDISNLDEDHNIKDSSGMVLRAMNTRTNKSGGLLIWSDGSIAYGAWNPIKDATDNDWKKGDIIELLDFPRPKQDKYSIAPVQNYKVSSNALAWNVPAENVRFGESGVVGVGFGDFEIEYELEGDKPKVIGVWSDSTMAPYSISYQDRKSGQWVKYQKDCKGSVIFSSKIKARKWRLRWEGRSYKSPVRDFGLSSDSNGGGFHAEFLVKPKSK